jgi:hypothetical protein
MKRSSLVAATIVAMTVFASSIAQAANQEPAGINLGNTSFFDGFGRQEAGLTYMLYAEGSFARRVNDKNGDQLKIFNKPQIDVYVLVSQFYFTLPFELFGGAAHMGLDFLVPIIGFDTSFAPPPPPPGIQLTDNGFGLGDITFGPALQFRPVMAAGRPVFVNRVEFDLKVPTGRYNPHRDINQSANFVSAIPNWALTVSPLAHWEISARLHYLYNGRNFRPSGLPHSPDGARVSSAVAGQAVWINFASSYEIFEKFHLGVNGYYFQQLTDDSYTAFDGSKIGASVVKDDGRAAWLAIGPGALYSIAKEIKLTANLYFQTIARSREQSKAINFRYLHSF